MGKTLNLLVMSALESQAPWPARRMRVMAWSMVAYCMEKSGLGVFPSGNVSWADAEDWEKWIVIMDPSLASLAKRV